MLAAFDCEDDLERIKWLLTVLLMVWGCLAGASVPCAAQGAGLHGEITDAAGSAVPGADVTVFRGSREVAHVQTDAGGDFTFSAAPREYRVIIRAAGFRDLHSASVPFTSGGTTRFTLRTGADLAEMSAGPVQELSSAKPWEYGVITQGGLGTSDRSNYRFLLLGGHLGKVLTPTVGSGWLKGNFEYAVEVFPFWQSYTPRFQKISCVPNASSSSGYVCSAPYAVGGTYTGVSITPIMLRWNFTHGARWMPWLQGAGGVIWTDHKYPPVGNTDPTDIASNGPSGDTSVWNFTPQFGIGTHYFVRPRQSVDFSANAVHISSSSLGDKNPGVNASVQFSLGYSWWK